MSTKQKIIIDTDPGVDDAMAIFLALQSPELEVLGLTTVFGNVEAPLATANALRLLEVAGRPDIPVAHGAENPVAVPYKGAVPFIHGDDGQGNVHLPPAQGKPLDISAAQFIVEQVMQQPGEITLVPIGPLTNIALALRLEPRIAHHAKVVLMGGNALCPGNASPAAEANIYNDPEAADVVLGAGWDITMVGLDVTHKVCMTDTDLAQIASMETAMARYTTAIVKFYRDFMFDRSGMGGIYVHDSTAVAYLLEPDAFEVQHWPVRVDTGYGLGRGKTWPDLGKADRPHLPPWQNRPNVRVCVGVKGERVVAMSLERMAAS